MICCMRLYSDKNESAVLPQLGGMHREGIAQGGITKDVAGIYNSGPAPSKLR